MGGKNSGRTTTVNTFCSKRKEPFPNFISSYDKHGRFNSFSSNTKKIIFQTKNSKICSSREDKGISPSLETTDKRSRALAFSRRLPNSSSNGDGSKSTKVKSGTAKTSRSGSEGNVGKGFHLSLKRGIFEQFVSDQQKRWREPTSDKFEGSELVHSLQALQDGRFALPEICVAKSGLHVQNRPEGCILQCSSTQRFTYSFFGQGTCTSSCAYALVWDLLPEYSQNY